MHSKYKTPYISDIVPSVAKCSGRQALPSTSGYARVNSLYR